MDQPPLRRLPLPSGDRIPALGQGTWHLGQGGHPRAAEIAALREGIELGMSLIDTAEMYGGGASEELVGEAIAGRREEVFLVSKVLPHNASRHGTAEACRDSLRRLGTDHLDLYLLHWPGSHPLAETIEAFAALRREGLIRHWGVSNFDLGELQRLARRGGEAVQTNQVLYNLSRRGIELTLLPWSETAGVPIMAYSPLEQGRLLGDRALEIVAAAHAATAAQVALAWLLTRPGVCAIPEAGTVQHVRENRAAAELELTAEDLAALEQAFPRPARPGPLEML